MKNDFKKVQTDLREIEDDLLDHTFVIDKLNELEDSAKCEKFKLYRTPYL